MNDAIVAFGDGAPVWIKLSAIEAVVPRGMIGCEVHLASGRTLHLEDMTVAQVMERVTEARQPRPA